MGRYLLWSSASMSGTCITDVTVFIHFQDNDKVEHPLFCGLSTVKNTNITQDDEWMAV